jgi:hypothetical protein
MPDAASLLAVRNLLHLLQKHKMTEVRRFSPWCQLCLDGDPRPDAHEYHALQMLRERAAKPPPLTWRWKQETPCTREDGAGGSN